MNTQAYNIPKDLIEDIEIQTGGDYKLYEEDLKEVYKNALIDLFKQYMTIKTNLIDIYKNKNLDKETKETIKELIDFRINDTKED